MSYRHPRSFRPAIATYAWLGFVLFGGSLWLLSQSFASDVPRKSPPGVVIDHSPAAVKFTWVRRAS